MPTAIEIGFVSASAPLDLELDPESGMWEASARGFGPVARGETRRAAIDALRRALISRIGANTDVQLTARGEKLADA